MIAPVDGMEISSDVEFRPGVYFLPRGLVVRQDNVRIRGNGAVFVGQDRAGTGIEISGRDNILIQGLKIINYQHGIRARQCRDIRIHECNISCTREVEANSIFLDIWRPPDRPYGAAILLESVTNSQIVHNDIQHQMNGVLAYYCDRLTVQRNVANYCSGFGFHLFQTTNSRYEDNYADFCCRFEPRGKETGHLGADSAGFLIVHNSCWNVFRRNRARMGGDGFFLSGLTPSGDPVPCNDNLFEGNDGSYSPNIAFEATFSARNVFTRNAAVGCNYGFWLGFSRDGRLEGNQIRANRQAGIAAENAIGFKLSKNTLGLNGHGVLLWSKYIPEFLTAVPDNETSANWQIENNTFKRNRKGVRIAADQDHGVRPYPIGRGPAGSTPKPHNHRIQDNYFIENNVGIELERAAADHAGSNQFKNSLEADLLELEL